MSPVLDVQHGVQGHPVQGHLGGNGIFGAAHVLHDG